jgi:cation transport ATPase
LFGWVGQIKLKRGTNHATATVSRRETHLFDKTGTLTVGGARLAAVEAAPGESADEVLRLAASLEQASHHIIATATVTAARSWDS